ncbi:MAG: RNA polymerase sigma factor [Acidimicrobiales bacterium]
MSEGADGTPRPPHLRARFEKLYGDHFASIYRYAIRRTRPTDVADVVSNVFLTAWRRVADVPDPPDDLLWLYGVARRVVAHQERTESRRLRLLSKLQRQIGHAELLIDAAAPPVPGEVSRALRALRPEARELVRLIVWEQLTHAEVAVILDCSVNAVAIRWHRALKRLRRELGVTEKPEPTTALCPPPSITGENR